MPGSSGRCGEERLDAGNRPRRREVLQHGREFSSPGAGASPLDALKAPSVVSGAGLDESKPLER